MGLCSASQAQPQESASTTALNQEYMHALQAQNAYTEESRPLAEKAAQWTRDSDGTLREMTEEEKYANMSLQERNTYDISNLAAARQKAAYAGELPISAGELQAQQNQFDTVKEALSRTGTKLTGTSFENATANSTSGAQNISERLKEWNARKDALARGEIDSGTSNLLNLYNASNQYGLSNLGKANTMANYGSGLLGNYAQAGNYFNQQQQMNNQMSMFNANASNQNKAGQMQLIGTVLGGAAGGYMAKS